MRGSKVRLGVVLERAQKEFFDLFNQLNEDKDYDVHCGWQTTAGTRIKHWSCATRYFEDELSTAAQLGLQGVGYNPMYVIQKKNRIMIEKTTKLLEENPELRELAERLSELSEDYREQYFNGE